MTKVLASINTASDTFQVLIDRTNQLITSLANEIVTVNSSANGVGSAGNGYVIGAFGANTLFGTTLRGGNLTTSGVLTVSSNLSVSGVLTVNTTANFGNLAISNNILTLGTVVVNSTAIALGNTVLTAAGFVPELYASSNTRTSVKANNTLVGRRSDLNFIAAGAATIVIVDNANNNSVDVTFSISGNSIVAGANTQIQYNDGGGIAASSNLTFDKTTSTLSTNNVIANTYSFKNSANSKNSFLSTGTTNTSLTTLDSFFLADQRGGEYVVTVKDNTANAFQISKLLVFHDGTSSYLTEYGTMYSNGILATFSSTANASHAILGVTTSTSNTTIKSIRQLIEA